MGATDGADATAGTAATGIAARTVVGPPDGLSIVSEPSSASTRPTSPARPPRGTICAPPAPSSQTSATSDPASRRQRISQRPADACLPTFAYLNLMAQCHPCYRAGERPPLDRGLTRAECQHARAIAAGLGLTRLDAG